MEEYIKSTIKIEWVAQKLLHDFRKRGPLIHIVRDSTESKKYEQLLVIQGSFDPPLLSHLELICQSLSLHQKEFPHTQTGLIVLLSLSHVEKGVDLFIHSLLGLRIEMLESLLTSMTLKVPWTIGISNSGRYIDLTIAIKRYFHDSVAITYIMGIDVFDKLFQGIYYSKPLKEILPEIFQTNYIVAGREDVINVEAFYSYLQSLPIESQNKIKVKKNVQFLPLQEKYQYESSTKVRKQLSLNQSVEIPFLHPQTFDFIRKVQLYSKNPSIIVLQIIIQIFIRLMIQYNIDLNTSINIIQKFISISFDKEKESSRILNEYRIKENQFLEKRCLELLKEHTSIN